MQQQAGQVMARWVQAEKLAIQHVRKPGHGMPVAGMAAKRPKQGLGGQASAHVGILGYIFLVIIVEKAVAKGGQVKGQRGQDQGQADQALTPQIPRLLSHSVMDWKQKLVALRMLFVSRLSSICERFGAINSCFTLVATLFYALIQS